MYILTINYLDGSETINSYETFPQVQKHISSIDKLVETVHMFFENQELEDLDSNLDESSHNSWGI